MTKMRVSDYIRKGMELVPNEVHGPLFEYGGENGDIIAATCLLGSFYVGFAGSTNAEEVFNAQGEADDFKLHFRSSNFDPHLTILDIFEWHEPLPTREQALATFIERENEALGVR